ncbi:putative ABC transport system permease protein [Chitinophaga costaii]|uniref:Putative ABC transport system permease protein n=1 Tax=Chitinophaga costaii TaxID=1335309 RepID=A0A1C3YP36_9BACT|nr:FtsX-like permease family protein [Chitinophaga costaii]PUZ30033.1 ABC transporter permease [Chitinophaga costaii]SCB71867.1 putative ABC transport system permease protein [Chitinophaga costaii]
MFKHLFILIWNKKKQNFLLLTEVLISFIVLFAVFTLLVFYYRNYKTPRGFDYQQVWVATYTNNFNIHDSDSLHQFYESLRNAIQAMPQVVSVAFVSSNTPYSNNMQMNGLQYQKRQLRSVNSYIVENSYLPTLQLQLLEGQWFSPADAAARKTPLVIDQTLREELFGNGPAIGQLVGDDNQQQIIGVVQDPKFNNDYSLTGKAMFSAPDTGSIRSLSRALVRVAPGADAALEGRLYKLMANTMKNANIQIEHLDEKRNSANNFALLPMIILAVVCGFLIINVALGLFGVLWYNINKRRGEIGLRRAVGATGSSIAWQLVAESLLLATLALLVGVFFAIQFPLLHVFDLAATTYLWGLLFAIVFIYVLVLVCSLYPGKQAAAIYPAVALHED